MSVVYSYYKIQSTSLTTILTEIKNRLLEKGWELDYDLINSDLKFAVHIPNTECYFRIRKVDRNPIDILCVDAFRGVDTDPIYVNYYTSSGLKHTYVYLTYIFVNEKHCILIQESIITKDNTNPHKYVCFFIAFGQLNIPNESYQGNYCISFDGNVQWWGGFYFWREGRWYYKNTVCSFSNIGWSVKILYALNYGNVEWVYYQYGAGSSSLPRLWKKPVQFGRVYLFTVPIFHQYEENGITYHHPISETPFYFCNYPGPSYLDKTLTYNQRVFKMYPLADVFRENAAGVAIEVDNVNP